MASALATQSFTSSGSAPTFSAADAAGHIITNSGRMLLYVKNGGGGSINVTITTPGSIDGLALPDKVVAVGAGAEKIIGGLAPNVYNATDGTIAVAYSGVTSVTVAAIEP